MKIQLYLSRIISLCLLTLVLVDQIAIHWQEFIQEDMWRAIYILAGCVGAGFLLGNFQSFIFTQKSFQNKSLKWEITFQFLALGLACGGGIISMFPITKIDIYYIYMITVLVFTEYSRFIHSELITRRNLAPGCVTYDKNQVQFSRQYLGFGEMMIIITTILPMTLLYTQLRQGVFIISLIGLVIMEIIYVRVRSDSKNLERLEVDSEVKPKSLFIEIVIRVLVLLLYLLRFIFFLSLIIGLSYLLYGGNFPNILDWALDFQLFFRMPIITLGQIVILGIITQILIGLAFEMVLKKTSIHRIARVLIWTGLIAISAVAITIALVTQVTVGNVYIIVSLCVYGIVSALIWLIKGIDHLLLMRPQCARVFLQD